MPAYKRTDPGKLARDRAAIQKSQESMNHPDHPAFEGIRNLFGALQRKIQSNYQKSLLDKDFGAPYGPLPLRNGAEEQSLPQAGDLLGSYVIGKKKSKSIT